MRPTKTHAQVAAAVPPPPPFAIPRTGVAVLTFILVVRDRTTPAIGTCALTARRRWHEGVTNSWHPEAACRSTDPDVQRLFDPKGDREPLRWAYARAEQAITEYCDSCPVRVECGEERDVHSYLGVWGGDYSEKRGLIDLPTGMLIRKHRNDLSAGLDDETLWEDLNAPDSVG